MPVRDPVTITNQIAPSDFTKPEFNDLTQQIFKYDTLSPNVQIKEIVSERGPKVDTYTVKVVDPKGTESTVTAVKIPNTQNYMITKVHETPAPVTEEPRTKETTVSYTVNPVTGTQVVSTTDRQVIKETPSVQNTVKKIYDDKRVPKTS